MVRKREGERLDAWLSAIENSQIQELQRFAQGILRDKDPVVAGLTQIHSNGPGRRLRSTNSSSSSAVCLVVPSLLC